MRRGGKPVNISDELIAAIYAQGWSLRVVARHLGVSHEYVRLAVKRRGGTVRPPHHDHNTLMMTEAVRKLA